MGVDMDMNYSPPETLALALGLPGHQGFGTGNSTKKVFDIKNYKLRGITISSYGNIMLGRKSGSMNTKNRHPAIQLIVNSNLGEKTIPQWGGGISRVQTILQWEYENSRVQKTLEIPSNRGQETL